MINFALPESPGFRCHRPGLGRDLGGSHCTGCPRCPERILFSLRPARSGDSVDRRTTAGPAVQPGILFRLSRKRSGRFLSCLWNFAFFRPAGHCLSAASNTNGLGLNMFFSSSGLLLFTDRASSDLMCARMAGHSTALGLPVSVDLSSHRLHGWKRDSVARGFAPSR